MRDFFRWLAYILAHRRTRYAAAWLLALGVAFGRWYHARHSFDDDRRSVGNSGHATIDFGGQWLMGRIVALGHYHDIYNRARQWQVAQAAYPRDQEPPGNEQHDVEMLVGWCFMGTDNPEWKSFAASVAGPAGAAGPFRASALLLAAEPNWAPERIDALLHPPRPVGVGGPLYPPIHAFVMAPLALDNDPQWAYFTMQWILVGVTFVGGLGVSVMSRGRFWWPLATLLIMLFPGYRGGLDLGQNCVVSLTLLVWGWALVVRDRPFLGGVVWGLLAFKPVWVPTFLAALVLMRRWRALLGMTLTGAGLVLATVPFVGIQTWKDWLTVGREAAALYNIDFNWVSMSRDLFGIPRRLLLDFDLPREERDNLAATLAGWALWVAVAELTLRAYLMRGDRSVPLTGPAAGLIFLAAWACCYRFMYYDILVGAFGVFVVLAEPARFFRPVALRPGVGGSPLRRGWARAAPLLPEPGRRSVWLLNSFFLSVLALALLHENLLAGLDIQATAQMGYLAETITKKDASTVVSPRVVLASNYLYPWDTVCLLLLWLWCVGRTVFEKGRPRMTKE